MPSLIATFIKQVIKRWMPVCAGMAGLLASAMAFGQPPDLSDSSGGLMSLSQEQAYGKQFMQMVRAQLPLVRDLIVLDYVDNLGYDLASHSPRPSYPFNFFIVNDSEINAFAGPGGNIGINSGLILAVNGEDELAAVIAHEIGHVVQRHFARGMQQQKMLNAGAIAAMVAALAIGIKSPDAGMGAMAATQAGMAQTGLSYSRQYEKEADNVGLSILQKSGYPTSGMTNMLKSLMSEHYGDASEQEILAPLMSHPAAAYRAAESLNILAKSAPIKEHHAKLFKLIQTRIAIDTNDNPQQLANDDETLLKNPNNHNKEILQYADALALLKSGQFSESLHVIDALTTAHPDELYYQIARANILAANKKNQDALNLLKNLYENNTDYYPVMIYYTHQLLQMQQASKALSILEQYSGEFDDKPSYLGILATAQYKTGNHAESDLTRAKLFIMTEQPFKARAILEIADKETTDPIIRAKIARELDKVNAQIKNRKKVF